MSKLFSLHSFHFGLHRSTKKGKCGKRIYRNHRRMSLTLLAAPIQKMKSTRAMKNPAKVRKKFQLKENAMLRSKKVATKIIQNRKIDFIFNVFSLENDLLPLAANMNNM